MAVNIGVARETAAGERRVALTPETCKKLVAAGATVRIEAGIGDGAYFPDQAYIDAGAHVTAHPREVKPSRVEALWRSRWKNCRARPARRRWTCSVRRLAWPVTRRS